MNTPTDGGPRQSKVSRPKDRPAASDRGRSRLGDITRPIAVERRLITSRRSTIIIALVIVVIVGALSLSLFGLPIRTYLSQNGKIETRQAQLNELLAINQELQAEIDRSSTDDGVREAAREQFSLVDEGQERVSMTDSLAVPTDLPAGWPYDLVTGVVALRTSGSDVGAPPSTITGATSTTVTTTIAP